MVVGEKRKQYHKAYDYLRKRIRFLDYCEYRRNHLPIGSGVTEAACKTVFTQRLKQSGTTWSLEGGQWIVDLRVVLVAAFPDQLDSDVRQALRPQHLPPQGIGPLPDATQQLRIGHLLPLGDEAGNLGDIRLGLRLLGLIHGYLQGDSIGDQDTDPIGFNGPDRGLAGDSDLRRSPVAQEGFEPSASLGLNESGLPVAYRALAPLEAAAVGLEPTSGPRPPPVFKTGP